MPKVPTKYAAFGAAGVLLACAVALIANAGRVCATVENPTGRAICETIVETAQEHRGETDDEDAEDELPLERVDGGL